MKRVYREHFTALLIFSLLAVFMTLPVALHMQSNIAGTGGDPWQTMWRFEEKANSGFTGFMEDVLGRGEARLANLSVWPWMPLHLIFGLPLAYNIVWLLHFVFAGYAMALFVKTLTNQKSVLTAAPILAGVAYMFMPYRIAHSLGHFGAMQLEWIPLIALCTIVFFRSPTIAKAALLGILLTIQAWSEHHYIVWIALFGLIAGFVYRKEFKSFLPSYEGRLGGVDTSHATTPSPAAAGSSPSYEGEKLRTVYYSLFILFLILLFGIIFPFIPTIKLAVTQSDALDLGIAQTIRFSADLFAYITPPSSHPVWGAAFDSLFGKYFSGNPAESVQYLGISVVIAILFFHKHIPIKQKRLWIAVILFFGVMSLGPMLHLFGKETGIPLPYALIANFPVFSSIRVIARAGVMVSFGVAVLFGWVIATNPPVRRASQHRVTLGIGLLILLEFAFFPFPMQSAKLSPIYDAMKDAQGSTIVEIPAATNYTAASRSLYAGRIHGKEVLGNIALERGQGADAYAKVKSVPSMRQLLYLRTTDLIEQRSEFFAQNLKETLPDAMKYFDTYAIAVHTDSLSVVQNAAITELLDNNPDFVKQSFGDAVLFTLDSTQAPDTDGVFMMRHEGWENIGYDPKRVSTFAEIPNKARVTIVNTNTYPVAVELMYDLAPESQGELEVEKTFTVEPGEREIVFTHTGNGKSIIQNPSFSVTIPLQPSLKLRPASTPSP